MLNPDLLDNKLFVREQLRLPFVVLENALIPSVAEELYQDLREFDGWKQQDQTSFTETQIAYQEKHLPGYTFSRHSLLFGEDALPASVERFRVYLQSDSVRHWMAEISGRRCDDFEGSAAMLKEGGHIADHNDYGVYTLPNGAVATRALTFNYYLTKKWQSDWGGNFVWKNPRTVVSPSFNTLILFLVGMNSQHHVEAVKPGATQDRMAITGWYRTIRRASEMPTINI